MTEHETLLSSLRYRRYRAASVWRCRLQIHRWQGYHDLGDGVNVQPISGYRKPFGRKDFRRCTWCGARTGVIETGDDRVKIYLWKRVKETWT